MAELARRAVAKYANAKSPLCSPQLNTRLIMEMYERRIESGQPYFAIMARSSDLLNCFHPASLDAERVASRTTTFPS